MVKATVEFWRFRAMHVVVEGPCEQSRSVLSCIFYPATCGPKGHGICSAAAGALYGT